MRIGVVRGEVLRVAGQGRDRMEVGKDEGRSRSGEEKWRREK